MEKENKTNLQNTKEKSSTTKKNGTTKILSTLLVSTIFIITAIVVFAIFLNRESTDPLNGGSTEDTYSNYDLSEFKLSVEIPTELKTKVSTESDGENIYVWGYINEEMSKYANKDSENSLPLFALNYSSEPFSNEKYSFGQGYGAYTSEDGQILYLHKTIFNIENADQIEEKIESGEELTPDEKAITEQYKKFYEEIENLAFYFKDGFKYSEL